MTAVGDHAPYVQPQVHDVDLRFFGVLPPGTRLSDDFYPADRTLVGTPTSTGTYSFSLQGCLGSESCIASQTFTIEVVPVGSAPATTMDNPTGVGSPPTAGTQSGPVGPASPVAAVPAFTG